MSPFTQYVVNINGTISTGVIEKEGRYHRKVSCRADLAEIIQLEQFSTSLRSAIGLRAKIGGRLDNVEVFSQKETHI